MKTRIVPAVMIAAACALPACRRSAEMPKVEPATLNVTSWTDKTELYMEYPSLVAGERARFAVHLTKLDDFKPLTSGQPRIEFSAETGNATKVLQGNPPSSPGAFRVDGEPPGPGRYRWALIVDAPTISDRHDLGAVTVFGDRQAAEQAADKPPDDPAAIAYLKEQQWTNDFATTIVREGDVHASVRVPAVIEPVTGGEAIVGAPAAGRFTADSLPTLGSFVTSGQLLGRLEPRLSSGGDRATLAADLAEARAAVDAARADSARAERLLAEQAVPARRVEDAHRAVAVAESRLEAARARLAQRDETLRTGSGAAAGNVFVMRAPIAGRLADIFATLGSSYDEGAPLFRIVRTDRVELRALVPSADAAALSQIDSIAFEVPGRTDPIPLQPQHMHDTGVLDPETKALAVQFEIANTDRRLLIGQAGTANLFTRAIQHAPVVNKAAVLMEAGRPYVFVHISGERFARRYIEISAREGDRVAIKSGVKPGERVVIRGAYDIQLASAAKGLPAEGHVH
jgi:membrane fusion protein, heavy metal efflux system